MLQGTCVHCVKAIYTPLSACSTVVPVRRAILCILCLELSERAPAVLLYYMGCGREFRRTGHLDMPKVKYCQKSSSRKSQASQTNRDPNMRYLVRRQPYRSTLFQQNQHFYRAANGCTSGIFSSSSVSPSSQRRSRHSKQPLKSKFCRCLLLAWSYDSTT